MTALADVVGRKVTLEWEVRVPKSFRFHVPTEGDLRRLRKVTVVREEPDGSWLVSKDNTVRTVPSHASVVTVHREKRT